MAFARARDRLYCCMNDPFVGTAAERVLAITDQGLGSLITIACYLFLPLPRSSLITALSISADHALGDCLRKR